MDDEQQSAEAAEPVPVSPLQALRNGLGRVNDLTQRDVDRLIARLRARRQIQDL
ncbi:hypothetical protein ABIE44_001814 [Marmoricola sp. OAE513]|uniref:hypothetical protein n=1 Tax=Marmoricola sp. OAE513 TaxID=2817894 RepID=UPI001AE1B741